MNGRILTTILIAGLLITTITPTTTSTIDEQNLTNQITNTTTTTDLESDSCITITIFNGQEKQIELPYTQVEELKREFLSLQEMITADASLDEYQDACNLFLRKLEEYGVTTTSFEQKEIWNHLMPSKLIRNNQMIHTQTTGSPQYAEQASVFYNTLTSFGEGGSLPVLMFPRFIPILMIPLPRIVMSWEGSEDSMVSCGSILNENGFIAEGSHKGMSLGFVGVGFTFHLPPLRQYGFIGYSMYTRVQANDIELFPPNYAPEVIPEYPQGTSTNIPIDITEIEFELYDANDDKMDYQITTNPDIGSGYETGVKGGKYSFDVEGLEGTKTYSWTITVNDGETTTYETFCFTTENVAPEVLNPYPEDEGIRIPVETDKLSIYIQDPQDDDMSLTVETSPDIGSLSQNGLHEGVVHVPISGLIASREYTWFVNITDGTNWKHEVFSFDTENIQVFDPFQEGWQYRKEITIDEYYISESQHNFPILVYCESDEDIRLKAQTDGDDLLFMNGDGIATRLSHEIESYHSDTGNFACWVNIPFLSDDESTTIYLYYGNAAVSSQQEPDLVWDEHYLGVWHMNPEDGLVKDSTSELNHGTMQNTQTVDGKIGSALEFLDYQSFVDCNPYTSIDDITLECWAYKDIWTAVSESEKLVNCYNLESNADWYALSYTKQSEDALRLLIDTGNNHGGLKEAGLNIVGSTGWHYITGSRDITNQRLSILIDDGSMTGSEVIYGSDLTSLQTDNLRFGARKDSYKEQFTGIIDEIRISDSPRDSSWLETCYNTVQFKDSFLEFGFEESG